MKEPGMMFQIFSVSYVQIQWVIVLIALQTMFVLNVAMENFWVIIKVNLI